MAPEKNKLTQRILKHIVIITSLLIILVQLIGCSFPGFPKSGHEVQLDQDNDWATDIVNIQFSLQIRNELLEGEIISLEILDEVSGLSNNKQTFDLEQINNLEYATNLSVPSGSILKYRYVKSGQGYFPELQFIGEPVRYRIYLANKSNFIKDILYSWQGDQNNNNLGVLSGMIKDHETDNPIPDILVSAGGQLTLSDANGEFMLGGLPHGEHNVLFYALDGKFAAYQQGAKIETGIMTRANVELAMQPQVKVSFTISPPNEALGAPIYLAGNILQLGNTFTDYYGSSSVFSKNMPVGIMHQDGTYSLELTLYSGTDLRYKFTLGDGYWNSEQKESGGSRNRQLIVPNQDIHLDINIEAWLVPNFSPITFNVIMPQEITPKDEKFIQFKTDEWTQPIPLWPVGDSEFLYILYSPFADQSLINYRFCRNADCRYAVNESEGNSYPHIIPSDSDQTITTKIESWENWHPKQTQIDFQLPPTPIMFDQYLTSIELTPEMDPSWSVYALSGFEAIADMGTKSVIISPQWFLNNAPPFISEKFGKTPYTFELYELMNAIRAAGLDPALYPQLSSEILIENWWFSQPTSPDWWDEWFRNYRKFILNYAEIAEQSDASQLILGGKVIIPTFTGGLVSDGSETDALESNDSKWTDLLRDIRHKYSGDVLWATNVNQRVDPLPEFIEQLDGVYIIIDSPLASSNSASFDEIAYSFSSVIDNFIYEIYRSTQLPITIALAYPSVDGAVRGCAIQHETCYSDGLFLSHEVDSEKVDLNEQALIYSAVLPIIASRNWISSTSIRGYLPTVVIQDGSSSLAGKPAFEIISSWFNAIKDLQE